MNELKCSGEAVEFECGPELLAFDIGSILEILTKSEFTFVPKLPDYIIGVINLMGDVIPVIDLRRKLGFEEGEYTDRSCLFVIKDGDIVTAVRVDRVITSLKYDESNYIALTDGKSIVTGYITDADGRRVSLLDAAELLAN